jgi:hypothetical protein
MVSGEGKPCLLHKREPLRGGRFQPAQRARQAVGRRNVHGIVDVVDKAIAPLQHGAQHAPHGCGGNALLNKDEAVVVQCFELFPAPPDFVEVVFPRAAGAGAPQGFLHRARDGACDAGLLQRGQELVHAVSRARALRRIEREE